MSETTIKNMESCVPLPMPEVELLEVVSKAKDWALMHGAAMRFKNNFNPDSLQFAPFILTPSSFPRSEFNKAIMLQPILNELMHYVAHDEEFLRDTLQNTIKGDEFTAQLFNIYEKTLLNGCNQPISLGLLRSDVMLESRCPDECQGPKAYCCWKQVEINTIASGFGHLGPISKELQSYVLNEIGHSDKVKNLPDNSALADICGAMIEAWKIQNNTKAAILFVIEDITYNICDQRFHEFYIRSQNPEIKVIRKTLTEIHKESKLDGNGDLVIDNVVVSVIYFRSGYSPDQYPSQNEWDARLLMEQSKAIKCPSIQYHLAGTKKVQQALAKPGVLERFLNDPVKIKAISDIFTGLYTLDDNEEGEKAIKMALEDPLRFVLKPQREGGGNNIYGENIRKALENISKEERSAWILMERIFPPITKGYMIRLGGGNLAVCDLVSELGIFGAIIGTKNKIMYNRQAGHMLRTKLATANEGGVAAGVGALDSPYLIDD